MKAQIRTPPELRPGLVVVHQRRPFLVDWVDSNGLLTLSSHGMQIKAPSTEVARLPIRGLQLSRLQPFSDYPPQHQADALQRKEVVDRLLALPAIGETDIRTAHQDLGCSRSTLYNLLTWYLASGCRAEVLIPFVFRFGRQTGRITPEVEKVIYEQLPFWLKPERPPTKELHKRIALVCKDRRLKEPSLRTLQRFLADPSKVDPYEAAIKRVGRKLANDRYRAHFGKAPTGNGPFQKVQLDHSITNILCRLRSGRVVRLYITLVIDCFTRMCLAVYVSPNAPCRLSIGIALSMAMQPKDEWLRSLGLSISWRIFGKPIQILTDSGREMNGLYFEQLCLALDIHEMKRQKGRPNTGSYVEAAMWKSAEAMEVFPGKTFRNVLDKKDYKPNEHATMSYEQIVRAFATYFHRYHHTPNRGLRGRTPISVYEKWCDEHPEELVQHQACALDTNLLKSLLPFFDRVIGQDGVSWEGYYYWGPSIIHYVGVKNSNTEDGRYRFFYDPRNVNKIFWRPPNGEGAWETLDVKDLHRDEMSEWDFLDGLRGDKEAAKASVDQKELDRADRLFHGQVDEAHGQSRKERTALKRTLKQQASVGHIASSDTRKQHAPISSMPTDAKPPLAESQDDSMWSDVEALSGVSI